MNEQTPKPFPIRLGIRVRLLIALVVAILIPTFAFFRVTTNQIFSGLSTIETAKMEDGLKQSLIALERELHQINANVQDYAHWDQMYWPETGRDPEWQRVNISNWIPGQFDIDVIWAADRDGNVYYQYNTPKEFQINVKSFVLFDKALKGNQNSHGIIQTTNGTMLGAASFISPAYFGVPFDPARDASGVLFYGRYIDSGTALRISEVTGLETEFFDTKTLIGTSSEARDPKIGLPYGPLAPQVRSVFTRLKSLHTDDGAGRTIFAPLHDAESQPALVISVSDELAVEHLVRDNLEANLLWGLFGSVTVSALIMLIFGTHVARVIHKLSSSIRAYTRGDVHHPISVTRTDELGELQASFANLIDKLNQAKVRIHEQEITILDIISGQQPKANPPRKAAGKSKRTTP